MKVLMTDIERNVEGEPSVPGGAGAPPPPPPMQLPGQILQLPRAFGGARIEIHGLSVDSLVYDRDRFFI